MGEKLRNRENQVEREIMEKKDLNFSQLHLTLPLNQLALPTLI
jgi:hypothetical protein